MIRTSAPLNLIVAGEWAVLEPKSSAIVAAINERFYCEIEPNPNNEVEITLSDFDIEGITAKYQNHELIFKRDISEHSKKRLKLIKFTIESALFLLGHFKSFKIRTWTEQPASFSSLKHTSFSLDYSGAAVVAVHSAIRAFYGISLSEKTEKEKLLKLCLITHFVFRDMLDSGVDIAAAFYGGILQYTRFNPKWVTEKLEHNLPLDLFTNYRWPHLEVKHLPDIPDLHLLLGWTQKPASQSHLIIQMSAFKTHNPPIYNEVISQINKLVKDLHKSWKKGDLKRILADIKINEMYLRRLSQASGIPIEIPEHKLLSHIADEQGGAGKLSGLGGGDCGIALCFDETLAQKILEEWAKYNIIGAEVKIDYDGLQVEEVN